MKKTWREIARIWADNLKYFSGDDRHLWVPVGSNSLGEALIEARDEADQFARLMLASLKERLEYCEANGLMPELGEDGKYPPEACIDDYWRKVIATKWLEHERQ